MTVFYVKGLRLDRVSSYILAAVIGTVVGTLWRYLEGSL